MFTGLFVFKEFAKVLQEILEKIISIDPLDYKWRHLACHILVAFPNKKVVAITFPAEIKVILDFPFEFHIDIQKVVKFLEHAKKLIKLLTLFGRLLEFWVVVEDFREIAHEEGKEHYAE